MFVSIKLLAKDLKFSSNQFFLGLFFNSERFDFSSTTLIGLARFHFGSLIIKRLQLLVLNADAWRICFRLINEQRRL